MVRPSLTDSAFLCRCGPFVIDGSHVEQSFSQPWRCTLAVFFDVVVTRCCAALVDCFQSAGSPRAPKSSPFLVLKLAEKVAIIALSGIAIRETGYCFPDAAAQLADRSIELYRIRSCKLLCSPA